VTTEDPASDEKQEPEATGQGESVINEVLAYYPRAARMSAVERRKAAARLRANMAAYECSDRRLKVLMLAAHQPELISEPNAFAAPCVDHAKSNRTTRAGIAGILQDRLNAALEQAKLVERNERLRRQRAASRRRNSELQEQLRGLKEIERSLQQGDNQ